MGRALLGIVLLTWVPSAVLAQRPRSEEGFEVGNFRFRPVAEALAAYDNRVSIDADGEADGDFYSEAAAQLYIENNPAMFGLSGDAGYGYRFYRDYADSLDNDFYQAGIAVESDSAERPLKLGMSAYLKKTLDYDTLYGPAPGQEPGAILTRDPSTRYSANANLGYEKMLTDKTSVAPGYDYGYYFQDFSDREDAEWQIHRASLQMGYGYSGKTRTFLTGSYSLQQNEEEDGSIGAISVGAKGSVSDKTSWEAHLGYAVADYEISGSGQGVVGLLRGDWVVTEKLSAYLYGRSNFQPGYSGLAARRVYRLGYGFNWRAYTRWSVLGQVLHDYQEELDAPAGAADDTKNFIRLRAEYDLTLRLGIGAGVRYVMDEEEKDQTVVALSAVYRY